MRMGNALITSACAATRSQGKFVGRSSLIRPHEWKNAKSAGAAQSLSNSAVAVALYASNATTGWRRLQLSVSFGLNNLEVVQRNTHGNWGHHDALGQSVPQLFQAVSVNVWRRVLGVSD